MTVTIFAALTVLAASCGGDNGKGATATTTATSLAPSTSPGSASPTSAPPDQGCTAARVGGELNVGQSSDLPGLDPTVVTGASRDSGGAEMTAIYDTLMRVDVETAKVVPQVAESLEPNADASVWTLKLRDGVRFGNGDALTAQAVIDSINRFKGAKVAAANFLPLITSMQASDTKTVVFTLTGPWGDFPYFLASAGGMIVDTNVVAAKGAEAFNKDPTGAGVGAYELVRYVPGEEVVMKAKTDYYGGPVCVQTLRFTKIADDQARYDALKLGEIGATVLSDAKVVNQAKKVDKRPGFTGFGNGDQLMINVRAGHPGADLKVREAMEAAIDVNALNQRVNDGKGVATTAIVHPDTALFSPGMDAEKPDAAKAKQLVTEARAAGWDGSLNLLSGDTPTAVELGITAQAMLQAAGMTVQVTNVPTADLIKRVITDKNFDVTTWSLNVLPEAPWSGIDRNLRSDSPTNRTGYADAGFDAALAQLRKATTVDEKKTALAAVQQVWNATVPGVMYQQDEEFLTWGDKVHGVKLTREGVAMFDDVYIDK
jgi:peptide/nickel transport system substrate-binding protein